jgi:hypothetical protein
MLGANGDRGLGMLYGGRVVAGLGMGAISNIIPIYFDAIHRPHGLRQISPDMTARHEVDKQDR